MITIGNQIWYHEFYENRVGSNIDQFSPIALGCHVFDK